VGITYNHPTKFRTNVLINYGEPFDLGFLADKYPEGGSEANNVLCRRLEEEMRPLMLDISSAERYDEIEEEWFECRPEKKNLIEQFYTDQGIIDKLLKNQKCERHQREQSAFSLILKIFGAPLFVTGLILNLPSLFLTKLVLRKTVIDPHFRQSIMFVCGMTIVPLLSLTEATVLGFIAGYFWGWLFFIPVSGIFAYDYYDRFIRNSVYVPTRVLAKGFLPR
ncbi:MAG: hypothetical protein P8X57_11695, partial [Cyclobacteriaceae bacterium]